MPKNKKYKMKPMPMPYTEDAMEAPRMKPMPYIEGAMETPRMKPMPYYEDDDMGLGDEALEAGKEYRMKKGGMPKYKDEQQDKAKLYQEAFKRVKEQDPRSSMREGEYFTTKNQNVLDKEQSNAYNNLFDSFESEAVGRKKGGKIKTHKMPGGKMMKNSDMKKKKKMGGGMMSDESFQYSKGGMVRGQGIAIKGTKFKGIF